MKRIRIIHRLRVAAAVIGFVAVLGGAGSLWWANHTGLPESWRSGIEEALANNGLHAEVASLRYLPLRGIEAGEVTIYADGSRSRVVGRLHHLIIDVDRSRLSRGQFQIDQLDLSGARVSLAVDADDPDSKTLEITDARGRIDFSGPREIEVSNASGMVGGVRLEATAIIKLFRPGSFGSPEDEAKAREQRRRMLLGIIETLETLDLETESPPRIRIEATGDLEIPGGLRASIIIQALDLKSRELDIESLELRGDLQGGTLVVHQAEILTNHGELSGRLDYDLASWSGRFELQSSVDLPGLMGSLQIPLPDSMPGFEAPPVIHAYGSFESKDGSWDYHVMGDADLTGPSFQHLSADRLFTRFSWDGSRLLLEDLLLDESTKSLQARVFITPERILYQGTSNLPLEYVQNAVKIQPLASILADFNAREDSVNKVVFEGMSNPHDPTDWYYKGTAEATGLSFRGVPTLRASASMDLDQEELDFFDGEVEFDYTGYLLRRKHGGPTSGDVTVGRILYSELKKTVEIEKLRGTIWPAPAVRTFAAEVADNLEIYGFHRPPALSADGVIDMTTKLPKHDLRVDFSSGSPIDYKFLGENLELGGPSASVRVLGDRVQIQRLAASVFDGDIRADIEALTRKGSDRVSGELDWTGLQLPEIARSYDFKSRPTGKITGRIDFSILGGEVSGFDGDGHVALEEAALFDVPIFGPLSPVISAVLGRRQAGFQEATSAFFTFQTRKGILTTNDFLTTTTSTVFTGDGTANLNKKTLDLTIRMNARGLLGVITLPLRPFYGLFQFRGSGPIESPEWKNVIFTSPPEEQEGRLLSPPKALAVPAVANDPPRARVIAPPSD